MNVNRIDDVICFIAKIRQHLIVEIDNIVIHWITRFAGMPVSFHQTGAETSSPIAPISEFLSRQTREGNKISKSQYCQ
jgi:hypothetical protein